MKHFKLIKNHSFICCHFNYEQRWHALHATRRRCELKKTICFPVSPSRNSTHKSELHILCHFHHNDPKREHHSTTMKWCLIKLFNDFLAHSTRRHPRHPDVRQYPWWAWHTRVATLIKKSQIFGLAISVGEKSWRCLMVINSKLMALCVAKGKSVK